jgi:ParB family chromosome partitioning protein
MAKSAQKVTLSPSRNILFDQLVLSQSNVRRIKGGISIEELVKKASLAVGCCRA